MAIVTPYVPEHITVHLGMPEEDAGNVTVLFTDYIKNVASSEVYPTWENAAIRANILCQISYSLNKVYLEYYRSRGYNFDITNTTQLDQKYIHGRNIFDNIDELVSEIFDSYIRRKGSVEPFAAKYCNGTTSTCDGLSQWGSQELAQQGKNSIEILEYYYGDEIEIVTNAPVSPNISSYPGRPLKQGATGENVVIVQSSLNRISQDYPLIPKINPLDGIFGAQTESSVKVFQGIFNLTQDGIVGRATWYKLVYLYTGVKKLAELGSEGQKIFTSSLEYPGGLSLGSRGENVANLQYFLALLSSFDASVPPIEITGFFGPETENALKSYQRANGLEPTGVAGDVTWDALYSSVRGVWDTAAKDIYGYSTEAQPFAGENLSVGSAGEEVQVLQGYLNTIAKVMDIPAVIPAGFFGEETRAAVIAYQTKSGLQPTGVVNKVVWDSIVNSYKEAVSIANTRAVQYPGNTLTPGTQDPNEIIPNDGGLT